MRIDNSDYEVIADIFNVKVDCISTREIFDITQELKTLQEIYNQQISVMKDFEKSLANLNRQSRELSKPSRSRVDTERSLEQSKFKTPILKANDLLEKLQANELELENLEEAAEKVSDQVKFL